MTRTTSINENFSKILIFCMFFANRSRELGSATLEMVFVAAGHLDAKVHHGIHCWDYAASTLMITEAGGVVLDTSGLLLLSSLSQLFFFS